MRTSVQVHVEATSIVHGRDACGAFSLVAIIVNRPNETCGAKLAHELYRQSVSGGRAQVRGGWVAWRFRAETGAPVDI